MILYLHLKAEKNTTSSSQTKFCCVFVQGYNEIKFDCDSNLHHLSCESTLTDCALNCFLNHSMAVELACRPGTYSSEGAQNCTVCPAGKQCPDTFGVGIRDCQAGEFSIGGCTKCTECPKGYACPNTTMNYMIKCDPGSYATGKKTECTKCRAGL